MGVKTSRNKQPKSKLFTREWKKELEMNNKALSCNVKIVDQHCTRYLTPDILTDWPALPVKRAAVARAAAARVVASLAAAAAAAATAAAAAPSS
jgi:hypothetical protein